MAQEVIKLPHKMTLNERKALTVTGVTEVVSFDEASVVLRTSMGTLVVDGMELQLKTLSQDGGQVAVEGKVSAMVYEETRSAGGFLQRLFG